MNKFLKVVCLSLFAPAVLAASLNQPAPDLTLKTLDGENLRLSEQKGDILLINFWASWCGPCRQEMPLLEELHQKYEDLGVSIWGVNIEQDSQAAKNWLKDIEVNFPILFDETNKASEDFSVDAMPTTVLVDRDGNIRFHHRGFKPGYEKKYDEELGKLVRE